MPISNKKELVVSRPSLDKDGNVVSWWLEVRYTQTGVKKGTEPFSEVLVHNAFPETAKPPADFTEAELIGMMHHAYDDVFDSHYQHSQAQA